MERDGWAAEIVEIAGFVGRTRPFDELDDNQLAQLARQVTVFYRRAGQQHLARGAPNPTVAMMAKGSAELRDGDRLIERVGEGGLLGVLSALTGQPVRYEVDFVEDSVIYVLAPAALADARRSNPAVDQHLLGVVEQRIQPRPRTGSAGTHLEQSCRRVASADLVTVRATATAAEVAQLMRQAQVSSLVVLDEAGDAVGLVTERMLVNRVLAAGAPATTGVAELMDPEPVTIDASSTAHEALLTMARHKVRHLPVVDGPAGPPVAMVTASDLLRARSNDPVAIVGRIERAPSPEAIAEATDAVPQLVESLMAADARAETTGRLVTSVTDAATRRLCDLAEARLGAAPMPYAFVAFGSQGRREQTAHTDQDNAMILAGEPDSAAADYFAEFAGFVCDGLDAAGYTHCPGDIMATNPRWRVPIGKWLAYVEAWVREPSPQAVLNAAVFFDVRHIIGAAELTGSYEAAARQAAGGSRLFLGHLAAAAVEWSPPLGFFRRFVVERDGDQKDTFDLKKRGVTPVIEMVRVLALEAGVDAVNTFDRIEALGSTESLAPGDADDLAVALEHIGYVRLQHQRRQLEAGQAPDNHVRPDDLSALERDQLKQAFMVIDRHQDAMKRRFSTGSVG